MSEETKRVKEMKELMQGFPYFQDSFNNRLLYSPFLFFSFLLLA